LNAKPNWGAYAASKFALRAFADVLRAEEAANGVWVTSVFPGRTATDMQRSVREQEGGEYEPDRYLRPESRAEPIISALCASRHAYLSDMVIRTTAYAVRPRMCWAAARASACTSRRATRVGSPSVSTSSPASQTSLTWR